jgi:hypothetical protein
MSLSEKLKLKTCQTQTIEVDGDQYNVTGKTKRERGALFAQARKKNGVVDGDKLESLLLVACVSDASDGSTATAEEWNAAPSHITGPLVNAIMIVCGMDKDDLGTSPKDSDSIES